MGSTPLTGWAVLVVISSSLFFFSSRRRHTRLQGDWSSDVCSSDLFENPVQPHPHRCFRRQVDSGDRCRGETRSEERRVGKECPWRRTQRPELDLRISGLKTKVLLALQRREQSEQTRGENAHVFEEA